MAHMTTTCPHCGLERAAMPLIGSCRSVTDFMAVIFCQCPTCLKPVSAIVSHPSIAVSVLSKHQGDICNANFELLEIYPSPAQLLAPEFVPESVERVFIQAEDNRRREHLDAAGAMFRKTLDIATKNIDPNLADKPLAARIKKLAETGKLTDDISGWAHEVRMIGNDATHGEEEPTKADIEDLRGLTEMILRYLYSLPGLMEARKQKAAELKGEETNDEGDAS